MKGHGGFSSRHGISVWGVSLLRTGSVWLHSSGKRSVLLAVYLGFGGGAGYSSGAQHLHGMNIHRYTLCTDMHLEKAEITAIGHSTKHPEG